MELPTLMPSTTVKALHAQCVNSQSLSKLTLQLLISSNGKTAKRAAVASRLAASMSVVPSKTKKFSFKSWISALNAKKAMLTFPSLPIKILPGSGLIVSA